MRSLGETLAKVPTGAEYHDRSRDVTLSRSDAVDDGRSLDMTALFARHDSDCYELYSRHSNEQLVRMLKMVGYDVGFCRGEGSYLYDRNGTRYLDLLSGFGVFAI